MKAADGKSKPNDDAAVFNFVYAKRGDKLMSAYVSYARLYSNIRSANPNMTPQEIRAKTEQYIKEFLVPYMSPDDFLTLLEKYPKDGIKEPRKFPRFTEEERTARRAKSELLRSAVLDHIEFDENPKTSGCLFLSNHARTLLLKIPTGGTPEEIAEIENYNREIYSLFELNRDNTPRNTEQLRSDYIEKNPGATVEDADRAIAERRAQIVHERIHEFDEIIGKLDAMTDSNLSPEQLTENYRQISRASIVYSELANFLGDSPALYTLSEEDRNWIDANRELQPTFEAARQKLLDTKLENNPNFNLKDVRFDGREDYNVILSRNDQRLVLRVPKNATAEERARIENYNTEVFRLFDTNKNNSVRNTEELRHEYLAKNPGATVADADLAISRRRARIVFERVHEFDDILDKLDELTDANLPAEELAENYTTIARACHMYGELINFFHEVPALFTLSKQERQWMTEHEAFQSDFSIALEKLRLIANPAFEYIDLDVLDNYDTTKAFNSERGDGTIDEESYEYISEDTLAEWKSNNRAKDAENYDKYTYTVQDWFSDILSDRSFADDNIEINKIDKLAKSLGFSSNELRIVGEASDLAGNFGWSDSNLSHGITNMTSGRPAAFSQNGRVMMFKRVNGSYEKCNPEEMFNSLLDRKKTGLRRLMSKADPWYHPSSDIFKEMRKAYEDAVGYGKLKSGASLNDAFMKYRALLEATEAYLRTKPENSSKKWEKRHIEMGKSLKKFAETKLNELETIEKARLTAKKYAGKTPEQIREAAAREDRIAEDAKKAQIEKADIRAHEENPLQWMQNRFSDRYAIDEITNKIHDNLEYSISSLARLMKIDNFYTAGPQVTHELAAHVAGAMIASEFVIREREILKSDVAGPVETHFDENDGKIFINLGKKAITAVTGKEYDDITPADFEKFVKTFDPEKLMIGMTDSVYGELGTSVLEQQIKGQYVNTIKPIRGIMPDDYEQALADFTNSQIVEPINEHIGHHDNAPLDGADARNILRDCVIAGLIQTERTAGGALAPGKFESMLIDNNDAASTLKGRITESDDFKEMIEKVADVNGNIPTDKLLKLFEQKEPQKLAFKMIKQLANEIPAQNHQKAAENPELQREQAQPGPVINK